MEMEIASQANQSDFEKVLMYAQSANVSFDATKLFEGWAAAKTKFFKAFDNKLIFNFGQVSFDIDPNVKETCVMTLLDEFYRQHCNIRGVCELVNFIDIQKEGFYENKVVTDYTTENGIFIQAGSKLLRAVKHFVDPQLTEAFQTAASMVIQETKVTGDLCFSVHPMDFISLSENTYNWRSCHALDGDYRAGNLNYMMDSSTIVCYLKGQDNAQLPNFPADITWNSKKWRMLLFFSDDGNIIFAGRQYPFFNRNILDIISDALRACGLIPRGQGWASWQQDQIREVPTESGTRYLHDKHLIIGHFIHRAEDIIKDGKNTFHYNDLLHSSCYEPYFTYRTMSNLRKIRLNIGKAVPCLHCGGDNIAIGDDYLCKECELLYGTSQDEDAFAYCDCCGARVFSNDIASVVDKFGCWSYYCPSCRETYGAQSCVACDGFALPGALTEDGRCIGCVKCNSYGSESVVEVTNDDIPF